MPNWCNNTLDVSGPKEDIKKYLEAVKTQEEQYDLISRIVPLPAGSTEDREFGSVFTDDGYNKAIELWGSKWADCDTYLNGSTDEYLGFSFQSAWGPPIAGFVNVSKLYPTLSFSLLFDEPGIGFRGRVGIKNGEIVEDEGEDSWGIDYTIVDTYDLSTEEKDQLQELFWDVYGDYVYDFEVSSEDITNRLANEIIGNRGVTTNG